MSGSRIRPELVPGEWEVQFCLVLNGERLIRCEACGQANVRFIHRLRHRTTAQVLQVGLVCCGELTCDPDLARRLENETKRKKGWWDYYGTKSYKPCAVSPEDLQEHEQKRYER